MAYKGKPFEQTGLDKHQITVFLRKKDIEFIDDIAENLGLSRSATVRMIIQEKREEPSGNR